MKPGCDTPSLPLRPQQLPGLRAHVPPPPPRAMGLCTRSRITRATQGSWNPPKGDPMMPLSSLLGQVPAQRIIP